MSSTNREQVINAPSLKPSRFDRVASLLISTLILSGTSVAVLAVLWLGTRRDVPMTPIPVEPGGASGEQSGAELSELDLPQLSELPQLAVAETVVELSTVLSGESIAAASTIDLGRPSDDSRPIGPPSPPVAVPRWERWEIRYEAANLQAYARQLDFFGIELGAVGRKPLVDYASRFSKGGAVTRSGSGSDEKRLYLTWRGGRLQLMDRELLERAGIDVDRRRILQFYPQTIEDMLARLEQEHAQDGRVDQLRKTIFGVRRNADGYEFFIIEQR